MQALIVITLVLIGVAGFAGFVSYMNRRDRKNDHDEEAATFALPRCASSVRILRSAGFTLNYWKGNTCRYCGQLRLAIVRGPLRVVTPAGETIVRMEQLVGIACLHCGHISRTPSYDITKAMLLGDPTIETPLLKFVEESAGPISRATYEAELDRLSLLASTVHAKLQELPASAYRDPDGQPVRISTAGAEASPERELSVALPLSASDAVPRT
jgi:hypothetical protein